MNCIYCESQPNDPSPCPCAHAPCVHDQVRERQARESAENQRLEKAVQRVAETIRYGAKIRGMVLPDDFAMERARNAVATMIDLFEDAEDAGYARGYIDGVKDTAGKGAS